MKTRGRVSGVEFDAHGNLWVIHRTDPPILEFDPAGNFVKSIGTGMFVQAHSLHFDRNGNLWATDGQARDGKGNQVFKFGPDGKVLLTLGKAGVAGDGPDVFNGVCDIVSAPNGEVFVADGHTNARVLKFSKDGKFIAAWGNKGIGPGEFNVPHAIAMDSAGRVFVGDRANNRIQIFDQNGNYITEWKQFGRPTGLYISKDDTLYVADDESNPTRNPGFTPGVHVGNAKNGSIIAFIPTGNTEPRRGRCERQYLHGGPRRQDCPKIRKVENPRYLFLPRWKTIPADARSPSCRVPKRLVRKYSA